MDYKYDNCSHVVFSLHDSRIRKISYNNHQLTLMVDKLFQYQDNQEKIYAGEVVFNDCSLDECNVLIFNEVIENGDFSGKSISLLEYINNYQSIEFEIISEGYFGYDAIYSGFLWVEGKEPVSAIMYIYSSGEIIYRISD